MLTLYAIAESEAISMRTLESRYLERAVSGPRKAVVDRSPQPALCMTLHVTSRQLQAMMLKKKLIS